MAGYPERRNERRVSFDTLCGAVTSIFRACRMRPKDASLLAHTLAWADLRGIHSHGVLRVPDYAAKLIDGGVDPKGKPRLVSRRGAALVVDGGNSMGQIGSVFAMRKAILTAKRTGVAVVAVRGSNHCGALAYYAMQAMEAGMIGLATTNALPTMAPWGGKDKIVGINPLAVAIPSFREPPIVLDCAFSHSSHGKIRVFQQMGLPIPPNWAFDRNGSPTTDAAAAVEGLLQPIGEHKGVGLGIVFGVLSTALSGASYGTDLGNMVDGPVAGRDGHLFTAIDIGFFTGVKTFRSAVDRVVRQIRESKPGKPGVRLHAPGGLEAATEARYRDKGIPLNAATVEGIRRVAAGLGVASI